MTKELSAHIDKLNKEGYKPDFVLIDYKTFEIRIIKVMSNKDLVKYHNLIDDYQQAVKEGKTEKAKELKEDIDLFSLKGTGEDKRFFRSY